MGFLLQEVRPQVRLIIGCSCPQALSYHCPSTSFRQGRLQMEGFVAGFVPVPSLEVTGSSMFSNFIHSSSHSRSTSMHNFHFWVFQRLEIFSWGLRSSSLWYQTNLSSPVSSVCSLHLERVSDSFPSHPQVNSSWTISLD